MSMRSESPLVVTAPNVDSEAWIKAWKEVNARDLIASSHIFSVDAESSVEEACDALLSENIHCLAVKSQSSDSYLGLFDFSDVNAFLTLAATRHTLPEELREKPLVDQIVAAAKAGRVPVHLVSNLSEKNPLETLPWDASILSLLTVFSRGTHRVLIQAAPPSTNYLGIVSDRQLLSWFFSFAEKMPSFMQFLSNPLHSLSLPSLNIYSAVVASTSSGSVLDAMKLMSEEGVSSVAVVEEETGNLLSAVSVTDIGKIVVPSQSNQILNTTLKQFISQIKEPDGSTDGADKCPVYSVSPTSPLSYTIQKLLATNSHRLFVTTEASAVLSPASTPSSSGNLSGIVSIVDILSLFARVAHIRDVDPTRNRRHRRASSASSHSSRSDRDFAGSRSSSRTSLRPSSMVGTSPGQPPENRRTSISGLDPSSYQWAERVPK